MSNSILLKALPAKERWPAWLVPGLLALLALLAYSNSFPGAFILDDLHIVQNSRLVADLDLQAIFRSDYWFGIENSGLYRPLTILSLALNRVILGEAVWGFHLVNVLLHAAIVALIYHTLARWDLSRGVAFMAAALFAVHPIHADVVNIAVGRSELLVVLFLLAAFCWARSEGLAAGGLVCLCFFAALLSKEHAITFLVLLPLWQSFRDGIRNTLRQQWRLYLGLLVVTIGWLVLYRHAPFQTLPRSIYSHEGAPLAFLPGDDRILTGMLLQWLYLAKLLAPFGLQAVYSTADLPAFIDSPFSAAGLSVLAGSALAAVLVALGWRKRHPLALFAALYLVSFAPTSNVFFAVGVSFAERLAYFPSLWFCAGIAALLGWLQSAGAKSLAWGLFVGYLLLLTAIGLWRNPDFASETRLWNAEVVNNPEDFLGWQNLAESLANSRRYAEAESAYRQMLALAPDYPGGLRARSAFLRGQGRYTEALETGSRALDIARSRGDLPAVAFDHVELADTLIGLQDFARALQHLDQVDDRMGVTTRLLELRGKALAGLGRYREAAETIERIVEIGKQSDIRRTYALSLINLKRYDEARQQLETDVQSLETAEGWNLLGVVCALQEDWRPAVEAFAQASRLKPANPSYRSNLERANRKALGLE